MFKIVGDNVDKNVKKRYLRVDQQNASLHFFHAFAVRDRIDFSHLPDTLPLTCSNEPAKVALELYLPQLTMTGAIPNSCLTNTCYSCALSASAFINPSLHQLDFFLEIFLWSNRWSGSISTPLHLTRNMVHSTKFETLPTALTWSPNLSRTLTPVTTSSKWSLPPVSWLQLWRHWKWALYQLIHLRMYFLMVLHCGQKERKRERLHLMFWLGMQVVNKFVTFRYNSLKDRSLGDKFFNTTHGFWAWGCSMWNTLTL